MATPQSLPATAVQVTRTFAAPRERVFRAWTDAKELALWFAPSTEYTTIVTELDLRVGGKYKLEMHHKAGNVHTINGTYRMIKPPEKLVYTWRWLHDAAGPDSVVSIEFRDLGGSTEVCLTHEHLPTAEAREKHTHGWNGCLEQLQNYLA